MKSLNLAFRFVLELGALAAFAYWGWQAVGSTWGRLAVTVFTPLGAATLWGRFIAPKARHRLEDPLRAGVEVVFFAAATVALAFAGQGVIAVVFGAAAALSLGLMFVFDQRGI